MELQKPSPTFWTSEWRASIFGEKLITEFLVETRPLLKTHRITSNPIRESDAAGLLTSSKLEQHAAVALVLPFAAVAFYAIGKVLDGVLYGRQVRASAFSGSKEQSRLVQ